MLSGLLMGLQVLPERAIPWFVGAMLLAVAAGVWLGIDEGRRSAAADQAFRSYMRGCIAQQTEKRCLELWWWLDRP